MVVWTIRRGFIYTAWGFAQDPDTLNDIPTLHSCCEFFFSNKKIGVLVITHVLLHSHPPGQSSTQRMLLNTAAMKWSMTFDRARGDERRPQGGGA